MKAFRLIMVILFAFGSVKTNAQKQMLAGINLNNNIYPDQIELRGFNIGATFESQMGKHSGAETGLFYRTDRTTDVISYSDGSGSYSYSVTIARRYLSLPLLYKYYSHRFNFSAGPAFDFYVGWKQKGEGSPVHVQSYTVSPKLKIGFLTKLSKTLPLYQNFILEPEIRFGSVQTFDKANVGIGIAGKYRF